MFISEEHISSVSEDNTAAAAHKVESPSGLGEDVQPVHQWRRRHLFLDIPSRRIDFSHDSVKIKISSTPTPTPKRVNFLTSPSTIDARGSQSPGPSSARGRSSFKNLLPKLSIKNRTALDCDRASDHAATIITSLTPREWPSLSSSLTKMFTPRIKKAVSLPVTPTSHSNPESVCSGSLDVPLNLHTKEVQQHISRSLSVPANRERRPKRLESFIRVVPSPRVKDSHLTASKTSVPVSKENDECDGDGEDIGEEEAVCRICLVELCEGGETFKMECSCKGELALAHKECTLKWFSIKGNKNCDVCKQEVLNLPVTLLRIQSYRLPNRVSNRPQVTEGMAGSANSCHSQHACLLLFSRAASGCKNGHRSNRCISSLLLCAGSAFIYDRISHGDEKVRVGLRSHTIRFSGHFCPHFLLLGAFASNPVYSAINICWVWSRNEWEFSCCGVSQMEKTIYGKSHSHHIQQSSEPSMASPAYHHSRQS